MKRIFASCVLLLLLVSICCGNILIQSSASEVFNLTSKSAYLVDYSSNKILYEKDATKHLPIASMVKMMTILLTLEEIEKGKIDETSTITTSLNASSMGGSQVFIDPYVEYNAFDLLKCVIIASANDASVALAEYISGDEKSFVQQMNKKAINLGMVDTNYVNCTGLPAPEQYSCAKDCAIVLKQVIQKEIYHKFSSIWMDDIVHPSGRKTGLVNTNRLIKYYDGCDCGKTGSTNEAGCCLSASAKRNDMRLISVIIGAENSKTRFNESVKLFNYGFNNFENKSIIEIDKPISQVNVSKGDLTQINVYADEKFSSLVKKGEDDEYSVKLDIKETLKAPLKQNDMVGKAIVSINGKVVKEIKLIVKDDVKHINLKQCFDKIVYSW